ncbi:hypothetical protein ACJ5H2_16785 [Nocardioides sp. R1-1]|uniref:hypothetical protein n=1 Tax=Nocardioides sp. R1-1 TaxID=3383502 RepID=UPI0038D1AAB9
MPEHADHDPVEDLARFGADLARAGGDMPLSAADVRRRGDHLRRRRTALVAGGAVLAAVAVTAPILALTGDDPERTDRDLVTRDPRGALGPQDLLGDDDTVHSESSDWFTTDTSEGDGQAAFHLCARESLGSLGATAVFQRRFELRNTAEPSVEVSGDHLAESIAQFPDAATAAAAYDTIAGWVRDCTEQVAQTESPEYRAFEPRTVDVEVGGDSAAQIIDAQYGPAPRELDPYGDAAYLAETGIVRVGDRLAVLDSAIVGQDYTFTDGTPVERMLPVAADLLRPGGGEPFDPTAVPGSRIADDFPLAAGWPEAGGETEDPLTGPLRGLDPIPVVACGETAQDPRRSDRLSAEWVDVEDVRYRQLTTYPSADAAADAVTRVADLYRACPREQDTGDGTTRRWEVREVTAGAEGYAVLGWAESEGGATPFGETLLVVRVGSAVLVESRGGHAGNPQGREEETIAELVEQAGEVVEAMCPFSGSGC